MVIRNDPDCMIAFSVDASEPGSYNQGRFDGAPSRPPSRTSNNKSPAGVIDLTEEHARGIYSTVDAL